ncbi:MAG: hypothetical protein NTV01_00275, partial [Bacteroidia bacterium]|nr:hypothetical protein [Bacteroidia bacterium]
MKRNYLLILLLFVFMGSVQSQERLESNGQIPILAWYGIPAGETTVARYQELKDAGITYHFSGFPNADAMQKALDIASKVGIKMIVSCPELKSEPEKTVRRFMNHPAVVGYHLMDEPNIALFPELSSWAKRIQSVDSKNFCYINLFPNFADSTQLGT